MKCYAHFDNNVVFTEDALKRKVQKIIINCCKTKNFYDDYFENEIPNFSDFLLENDYANDVLMDVLLNKNVSVIEELEEDFYDWCFETYFEKLTRDIVIEMGFEE